MKVPRKIKKKIPKGHYCYTPTSEWKEFEDGKHGFSIKCCPFYYHKSDDGQVDGHCRLLKSEIMDQVKDCSINVGKY